MFGPVLGQGFLSNQTRERRKKERRRCRQTEDVTVFPLAVVEAGSSGVGVMTWTMPGGSLLMWDLIQSS